MTDTIPQNNYQLKRGTALVIVGPQGCGKSTLAQTIAKRRGKHQEIETGPGWGFHLRDALNGRVDVLIVDGVPGQVELVDIKCMMTNSQIQVRPPYASRAEARPSPLVIICTQDANWLHDGSRRFDVIDMNSKAVDHERL